MRRRARAIRDPDPRLREKRTSKNPLQSNTNSTRWQMFPTRKWDRKWLLRCAAWRPLEKTNNLCGCNKILWLWNGRCCLSCKRNDLGGWCRLSTFSGLGTNTRWIRVNMSGGAMRSEQRETWMQNSNVAILLLHSQQLGEEREPANRNQIFRTATQITTETNAERWVGTSARKTHVTTKLNYTTRKSVSIF